MAVEIHIPNIYGPIELAANQGILGQVVTSQGPGVQPTWSTPAASSTVAPLDTATIDMVVTGGPAYIVSANAIISPDAGNEIVAHANGLYAPSPGFGIFKFTSALALTHTIVHNLNNAFPNVTVWDQASGDVIVPSTVSSNGVNSFDVTFFVARAIAGTVVG